LIYMNQLQDVYGVFLHHRQKYSYGSRIVSGYSINAQNSSCSTKSFRTLVRSWMYTAGGKLVQQSRISIAAKIERCTDDVHFENRDWSASRSSSLVDALTLSRTGGGEREIFELICTYLHFTGTSSVPTYQGNSNFFRIYPLYVISTEYYDPCNYQTRTDENLILFCTGSNYHQNFRVWNKKFDLYESTTRCLRCFLAS